MQMPWEISERKPQLRALARDIVGSKKAKALIFAFDGKCYYCTQPIEALGPQHPRHPTRDHKTPKVRNGKDGATNIVLACITCNVVKGDMNEDEFRHFVATGTLASTYVDWIATRLRKIAISRGVKIGDSSSTDTKKEG